MSSPDPPRLYDGWTVERGETPVSNAKSLRLVSLADDGELRLTLEDGGSPERPRWRVTFREVLGYLNLAEEYRLELWERGATSDWTGWTLVVPGSPWLALLSRAEALVSVHHPAARHYQVGTEDDVIDVFASAEPLVEDLGPAPPESPPAGRSTTLHWPEDRAQIQAMLNGQSAQARSGEQ